MEDLFLRGLGVIFISFHDTKLRFKRAVGNRMEWGQFYSPKRQLSLQESNECELGQFHSKPPLLRDVVVPIVII